MRTTFKSGDLVQSYYREDIGTVFQATKHLKSYRVLWANGRTSSEWNMHLKLVEFSDEKERG